MTVIRLSACVGMIAGFFFLFRISPMEFVNGIFSRLLSKPMTLRDAINETTRRKKSPLLRREIAEIQDILKLTDRESQFGAICAASLILFAVGTSIAILMNNPFLAPVMAVGLMFMPFWYVRLTLTHYKRDIAAELETALSIITTAYLRSEDVQTAIEENLEYLNPPAYHVFKDFLTRIKLINPDVESALLNLKNRIDNEVFHEWVDAIASCQYDRSLKSTLIPIVNKLSDMRIVNGELDNLVFEPRKEFIIMAALVIGNLPLMYFLNASWYNTLTHTSIGQAVIAVCAAAIFVSTAFVIKLTQPIEYRR